MHMDSLHVPMFGHHVCPRRSAEGVRSCVIRATVRRELLCRSKKQAWVPWKNKPSSSSLCSLQLSASFLIGSQSVQSLSHRREGCRLSLDCWSYVTRNCGLQRGMPCTLDFYCCNKIPVIILSDKGKRVILAQSFRDFSP